MSIRFKAFTLMFVSFLGFVLSLLFINKQLLSNKVDSYESAQVLKEARFLRSLIFNDIKSLNYLTQHLSDQPLLKEKGQKMQQNTMNSFLKPVLVSIHYDAYCFILKYKVHKHIF